MSAREKMFGKGSYYFRAYHYPSNPYLFHEFNELSVNDIVSYNLVVESNCLSLVDGRVRKKIVGRLVETFSVR